MPKLEELQPRAWPLKISVRRRAAFSERMQQRYTNSEVTMSKQKLMLIATLSILSMGSSVLALGTPTVAHASPVLPCANAWCEPNAQTCHYQAGYACYLQQTPPYCSGNIAC